MMSSSSSSLLVITVFLASITSSCCKAGSATSASSCGNIDNISCPFYLKDHAHKCHGFSYELSCRQNRTTIKIRSDDFYVEAINFANSTIRLIDSGLARNNYSCYSTPLHAFNIYKSMIKELNRPITNIDCPAPLNKSSSTRYIPTSPCSSSSVYSYVVIGFMNISEVENNCTVRKTAWVSSAWPDINKTSFLGIYDIDMVYGVELPFLYFCWLGCNYSCVLEEDGAYSCKSISIWLSVLEYLLVIPESANYYLLRIDRDFRWENFVGVYLYLVFLLVELPHWFFLQDFCVDCHFWLHSWYINQGEDIYQFMALLKIFCKAKTI